MLTLQIIIASTRPSRQGPLVAEWFLKQAQQAPLFNTELVDLAEVNLPLLDEAQQPRLGMYEHEHTQAWSAIVQRADAFVIVTPEYDHSTPAALSNALQYLVREWAYKPVGFVSYGGVSAGLRGVQMSKLLVTALNMMPIPPAVAIPFFTQYIGQDGTFDPGEMQEKAATVMLAELAKWGGALKTLRESVGAP